jgi:phage baseplate assembly protein W
MMGPRDRAWRFVHPDLESGYPSGLNLSPSGGVAMVEGDDSVRQALLLLLSTRPGERVMRPDYGCDLHRLVFAPNDDTTAGLAIHYVQQALDRWEPRVEVVDIDAGRNPINSELLEIRLVYRVRASQRQAELSISLSLAGGAA